MAPRTQDTATTPRMPTTRVPELLRAPIEAPADRTLRAVIPLGYQKVRPEGGQPYAQLRATARVDR